MNLDEMKKIWDRTDSRLAAIEEQNARFATEASMTKRRTALDYLTARYTIFSAIGTIMAGVMICYGVAKVFPGPHSVTLSVAMAAYFALVSVLDLIMRNKVRKIDIERMSVSEVSERVLRCRRYHLRCMAVLIPIAAILLCALIWSAGADTSMLIAMCIGAACGLVLGIRQYLRFMAAYRILRS